MSRSLSEDYNNPNLFEENKAGEYTYTTNTTGGKTASGSLALDSDMARDAKAQTLAGGDSRREGGHEWGADDGGHLIGARFGGATGEENLTAQNRNLNRSGYKQMENRWAEHLDNGDKVYVNVETDSADRPNAYMGYAIYEDKFGRRTCETFHYVNESKYEMAEIESDFEENVAQEDAAAYAGSFDDMESGYHGADYLGDCDLADYDKGSEDSYTTFVSSETEHSASME